MRARNYGRGSINAQCGCKGSSVSFISYPSLALIDYSLTLGSVLRKALRGSESSVKKAAVVAARVDYDSPQVLLENLSKPSNHLNWGLNSIKTHVRWDLSSTSQAWTQTSINSLFTTFFFEIGWHQCFSIIPPPLPNPKSLTSDHHRGYDDGISRERQRPAKTNDCRGREILRATNIPARGDKWQRWQWVEPNRSSSIRWFCTHKHCTFYISWQYTLTSDSDSEAWYVDEVTRFRLPGLGRKSTKNSCWCISNVWASRVDWREGNLRIIGRVDGTS